MLNQLWQWLKRLIRKLFGHSKRSSTRRHPQGKSQTRSSSHESNRTLSDGDYEFLFIQLLEGVAYGWQEDRITQFFGRMETISPPTAWLDWLHRFGTKVITSSPANPILAARLIRLGESVSSLSPAYAIAQQARGIGQQLLTRETPTSMVWEYEGPDLSVTSVTVTPDLPPTETVTIDHGTETTSGEVWEYDGPDLILTAINPAIPAMLTQPTAEPESMPNENAMLSTLETPPPPELSLSTDLELSAAASEPLPTAAELFSATDPESSSPESSAVEAESASFLAPEPDSNQVPVPTTELPPSLTSTESSSGIQTPPTTPTNDLESLSLDQFYIKLKQQPELVGQMAQQLGIQTEDPQVIMETLIWRLNQPPSQSAPVEDTVEAWFQKGLAQASTGDLAQAITSWDRALARDPTLFQAWYNRGSALASLKRLPEAIASFERAIALNPQNHHVWYECGTAYYSLEAWEKAIASWDKVLSLHPQDHQACYNRGCAFEHLHNIDAAINSYTQALALQPDFEPAQTRLTQLRATSD